MLTLNPRKLKMGTCVAMRIPSHVARLRHEAAGTALWVCSVDRDTIVALNVSIETKRFVSKRV